MDLLGVDWTWVSMSDGLLLHAYVFFCLSLDDEERSLRKYGGSETMSQ